MTTENYTENLLSKDELLRILNDIDSERQSDREPSSASLNTENQSHPAKPDPSNPFH